jgi:hypothetical protein
MLRAKRIPFLLRALRVFVVNSSRRRTNAAIASQKSRPGEEAPAKRAVHCERGTDDLSGDHAVLGAWLGHFGVLAVQPVPRLCRCGVRRQLSAPQ